VSETCFTESAFKEAYGPIETNSTETHQKHSNTANDGEVPYGIDNKGDNNEASDGNKDDRYLRTTPPTGTQSVNAPEERQSTPLPLPMVANPPTATTPRRSERHKRPTQAAIESAQTEETYGRKPRAQQRRVERRRIASLLRQRERSSARTVKSMTLQI